MGTEQETLLKGELRELMKQKDALEQQITEAAAVLASPGMGGLRGALVDAEGFPRAEIDVHGTRTLRNRHSCLNTDHKALMSQIEAKMHAIYALPPEARATRVLERAEPKRAVEPSAAAAPPARALAVDSDDEPWGLIDEVMPGGPAETCGLCVGDALLRFGNVDARTSEPLAAIARVVGGAEGQELAVVVRRRRVLAAEELVVISLRPSRWSGRGLLGMHISPLGPPVLTQ